MNDVPGREQMAECTNDNGVWTCSGMLTPVSQKNYADCTDGLSNTMIVGEQSDYLQDVDVNVSAKYRGDPGWTGATGTHRGWISGTNAATASRRWPAPTQGVTSDGTTRPSTSIRCGTNRT